MYKSVNQDADSALNVHHQFTEALYNKILSGQLPTLVPLQHAHKSADANAQTDPNGYTKAMIMAINFYTGLIDM